MPFCVVGQPTPEVPAAPAHTPHTNLQPLSTSLVETALLEKLSCYFACAAHKSTQASQGKQAVHCAICHQQVHGCVPGVGKTSGLRPQPQEALLAVNRRVVQGLRFTVREARLPGGGCCSGAQGRCQKWCSERVFVGHAVVGAQQRWVWQQAWPCWRGQARPGLLVLRACQSYADQLPPGTWEPRL